MPSFEKWLLAAGALLACAVWAAPVNAALVWEPVGPVPPSTGMTAVASDPDMPSVVWIGSASTVWVSEDAGETFSLVLQLSRATAVTRATGTGEQVEVEPPEPLEEPDDPEDPDQIDDSSEVDPETGVVILEDAEPVDADPADMETDVGIVIGASGDASTRFGINRIRVIGGTVYICTGRGLWTIPRTARRPGSGRELRFGRRIAVNDVGEDAAGQHFVATDGGLYVLGQGGIGRQVSGIGDENVVSAIAAVGGRLVIATGDGLYIQSHGRFQRLGISSQRDTDEGVAADLMALSKTQFALAAGDRVSIVEAPVDGAPYVLEAWPVPGVDRLGAGRDGTLWAIGGRGAWQYDVESGWRRHDDGLVDRRLMDVATSASGTAHLYIVGRGGTARLVPEGARVWSSRARFQARRALEGLPEVETVLSWAADTRPTKQGDAEAWLTQRNLSWLAPRVLFRWVHRRTRDEKFLLIAAIDRRILDDVRIGHPKNDVRVELRWDLAPALMLALDGTDSQTRMTRTRARRALNIINETVAPLHAAWAKRRIALVASEPESVRQAARDLLAIQHIEADLHVYTGGRFPIIGVTDDRDPVSPATSRSEP